ncbi:hypothetical protein GPECTOR_92g591 [Gonium pectorale]|uniref:Uncharacterized protein n=1 Tax=Gonium pectorale TaxID=33097 RepID=A0A150G0K6_GONPE|nr:hypothetical protein GPECTOR_92g591 [Gonium pectorale]|eukprot:KXZ43368.1 hypothetical protein GPECTOR_92g591 [Gonium pectorale]
MNGAPIPSSPVPGTSVQSVGAATTKHQTRSLVIAGAQLLSNDGRSVAVSLSARAAPLLTVPCGCVFDQATVAVLGGNGALCSTSAGGLGLTVYLLASSATISPTYGRDAGAPAGRGTLVSALCTSLPFTGNATLCHLQSWLGTRSSVSVGFRRSAATSVPVPVVAIAGPPLQQARIGADLRLAAELVGGGCKAKEDLIAAAAAATLTAAASTNGTTPDVAATIAFVTELCRLFGFAMTPSISHATAIPAGRRRRSLQEASTAATAILVGDVLARMAVPGGPYLSAGDAGVYVSAVAMAAITTTASGTNPTAANTSA